MKKFLFAFVIIANLGVLGYMSLRLLSLELSVKAIDCVMTRNKDQLVDLNRRVVDFSKELDEAKRLKLEIPESTVREIADAFKNVAGQIHDDVTNAVIRQNADADMVFRTTAASRLDETLDSLKKTLPADLLRQAERNNADSYNALTNAIATGDNKLCQAIDSAVNARLERAVAEIGNKMPVAQVEELKVGVSALLASNANKTAEFLKAAERQDDVEIKNLLYIAAVNVATEKKEVLKKYAEWVGMEIDNLLQRNDSVGAESRYNSLLSIFNVAVNGGSVSDIEAIPELRHDLIGMSDKIQSYNQERVDGARKVVDSISHELSVATSAVQCVELARRLEGCDVPNGLDTFRDRLAEDILFKQSYFTLPTEPVIVPPINERTPWIAWFENFVKRMEYEDVSRDARLSDLASISEFYSAARRVDDAGLRDVLRSLDSVSAKLYVADWKCRVKALVAAERSSESLHDGAGKVAELIQEVKNFDPSYSDSCKQELVSLNELLLCAAEREIEQSLKTIKSLESSIPRNDSAQLLGAVQGQCLQMIMKIATLQGEFPGAFQERMSSFKAKVAGMESVLTGYREYARVKELENVKKQREEFLRWAKDTINAAETLYNEGESLASRWKYTRGSDACQAKYRAAWDTIMMIYEADLSMEDPAMFGHYSKVKAKIEKARPPAENELKNRNYRRRESF